MLFSSARIRMPISDDANPRDFITKILGYKKITSLPNSMTVMSDILPILLALAHDGKFGGRVNACNKGWYVKVLDFPTKSIFDNYLLKGSITIGF